MKPLGNGVDTIRLAQYEFCLPLSDDLAELSIILRGIIFCQTVTGVPKDHGLLHGITLLFASVQPNKRLLKSMLDSCQARSCLDYADDGPGTVLYLAKSIASNHFTENRLHLSTDPSLFSGAFRLRPVMTMEKEFKNPQFIYYWFYNICVALSSLGHSLDWARPMEINVEDCELFSSLCLWC
jgi:hypothetical protein